MRDIGTWSNEQIAKGPKRNQANNEEDNEEEWQGDLTQTQIFTATNQRKESNENKADLKQKFDNDFPIGHFNAEEATQKIKKAVGIGSTVNDINK